MKKIRNLKNKLKKLLSIILILTIIITIIIIKKNIEKEQTKNIQNNNIKNILSYQKEEITEDFLKYISDKYSSQTIDKLYKEVKNNTYEEITWHKITGSSLKVLKDKFNNIKTPEITTKKDITLDFIGDVSLADNWYIMKEYDKRQKGVYGILSSNTIKELKTATLSIANNEFTISSRGEKISKLYNFKASPERLKIYNDIGIDLVTLANNHVYDYGSVAFNDTLNNLNNYKISYIGAGKNIEEASKPYNIIINGYKISFINANRSEKNIVTPGATETNEGVFRCYDPTDLSNKIKELKINSDYVIALIHWGKEDSHELEEVQITTSKLYIDSGADAIIGTHAHVLQGIDFYKNKPIIYNLGDFIFNNETKETGIYQLKINKNGLMESYFIPALQKDEYTKILENEEKQYIIDKIKTYSPNINIDDKGKITPK